MSLDILPIEVILDILAIGLFSVYWIFVFVILYHLTRFGIGTQPKKFAALFFTGSVIFSAITFILFFGFDISNLIPK